MSKFTIEKTLWFVTSFVREGFEEEEGCDCEECVPALPDGWMPVFFNEQDARLWSMKREGSQVFCHKVVLTVAHPIN